MKIDYTLFDPTGNITVLVETPVSVPNQPDVAKRIMEIESTAQQVGFVNEKNLRMAGGEFCGNASLCAAVLYCKNNGIYPSSKECFELSVSGTVSPVNVELCALSENKYTGSVEMPKAISVEETVLKFNNKDFPFIKVDFGNITHIVTEQTFDDDILSDCIADWCSQLEAEALGIMQINQTDSRFFLKPLVFVPKSETLVWESSCASGTAAAGIYIAKLSGKYVDVGFSEPGGVLSVKAFPDGSAKLTGQICLIKKRTVEI